MHSENLQAQLEQYVEQQRWLLHIVQGVASSEGLDALPPIMSGLIQALGANCARMVVALAGTRHVFAEGEWGEECTGLDGVLLNLLDAQAGTAETEFVRGQQAKPDSTALATANDVAEIVPAVLGSLFALRLNSRDGLWQGILWVGYGDPSPFNEGERVFLRIVAALAENVINHAVQDQREMLSAVLASTPDPVLVVSRELQLQMANPAAQEAFEALQGAVPGQRMDAVDGLAGVLDLFGADNQDDPASRVEYAAKKREFIADNGKAYAPRISDVRTKDGTVTGWVLVLRDISPFKRLNDNMSEFLSTVSHDMRSPLTYMKGYCDMLGMVGPLNERQTGFTEKIAIGVVQMSDMVEKILDAAKIDPVTGNYTLSREACDMKEMVEKIVNGLAEPAARQRLEMTLVIDPGAPVLSIDRGMMSSAYTNLVENAIKYTPEGGKVKVELIVDHDQNALRFRVADNGLGISEADQRKLFQRNVRVRRQEWVRIKGSGLGLFIVKNVAQRHGGDAWVESTPGEGSTFTLVIPMDGPNMIGGEAKPRN